MRLLRLINDKVSVIEAVEVHYAENVWTPVGETYGLHVETNFGERYIVSKIDECDCIDIMQRLLKLGYFDMTSYNEWQKL